MASVLIHRGPDDYGEWIHDQAFIGHVRLSIIDLECGTQPIVSMNGKVIVTFNGEIYNYAEIWKELKAKGYRFQTDHSDTEVILNGYIEWGCNIFKKLNGMFAISIYDKHNNVLVLARDRMGIKPLYYAFYEKDTIIWASEPKALLATGGIPFGINAEAIPSYLLTRAPGLNNILHKNIFALAPGCFLEFNTKKECIISKYWELKANDLQSPYGWQELEEKTSSAISKSVFMETISDVPIGLFLSGGVDSSLIAYFLKHQIEIETYTIGTNSPLDESKIALQVSNHEGLKNHLLVVEEHDFANRFDDWMFYNDDPVANPSALALMLLGDFARSHGKKVMLSGDGADELFGGYESYLKYAWIDKILPIIRLVFPKVLIRHLWVPGGYQSRDYLCNEEIKSFLGTAHITDTETRRSLLKGIHDSAIACCNELNNKLTCGRRIRDALLLDQATRLPCDSLMTTDRATMAVSLETRVPFLNQLVVDVANRLPDSACVSKLTTKLLLKSIASKVFPCELVYRPKLGFDLPIEKWLKGSFQDRLYSFIQEKRIDSIDYSAFKKVIDEFLMDKISPNWRSPLVWSLLTLETWYRRWSNNEISVPVNDYVRSGLALKKIGGLRGYHQQ